MGAIVPEMRVKKMRVGSRVELGIAVRIHIIWRSSSPVLISIDFGTLANCKLK
jgi:hypothetical protein